jgi:hypothetical protein
MRTRVHSRFLNCKHRTHESGTVDLHVHQVCVKWKLTLISSSTVGQLKSSTASTTPASHCCSCWRRCCILRCPFLHQILTMRPSSRTASSSPRSATGATRRRCRQVATARHPTCQDYAHAYAEQSNEPLLTTHTYSGSIQLLPSASGVSPAFAQACFVASTRACWDTGAHLRAHKRHIYRLPDPIHARASLMHPLTR